MPAIPFEARRAARSLYWRGWSLQQISDELSLAYTTIASWKSRDKWDGAPSALRIEAGLEERYLTLIAKENKSGKDFKEIDLIRRQREGEARIAQYSASGKEADLNPNIKRRNDEKAVVKRSKKKNRLTFENIEACRDLFENNLFQHQREWWDASSEVIRFILKSRQIGATWYFAREAFMRALDTGNNQIFLSASKNQSDVFRAYIREFVEEATGIELTGSPMVVNREDEDGKALPPVTFYFLATNYRTAQSYHGDVYIDECFFIGGFSNFDDAASGMASQKFYRLTYFSKPSTVNHPAYAKWSGGEYNSGRPKSEQCIFDIRQSALKSGKRGPDGIWRQIVTVDDAIAKGFDLIDRESIERRYSPDVFRNQYLCEFIDDSQSSFPHALIGPCRVDSFYKWRDFKPALVHIPGARPFGNKPVWIGVDPNNQGKDDAAICVLAPPETQGGKFRLLQKMRFTGEDFAGQDRRIIAIADLYNVEDISVDTTGGMGKAVFELVQLWFPAVRRIDYSVSAKAALVLKAQNVMRNTRFEFDAGDTDVQSAFMSIRPAITPSGKQITYITQRVEGGGHGDIAWAIMHAFSNEPMNAALAGSGGGTVDFLDD